MLVSYTLFCIISFPCIFVKIISYTLVGKQCLIHPEHLPFSDLAKQEANPLVVSRIEPKHTTEDLVCLFVPAQV